MRKVKENVKSESAQGLVRGKISRNASVEKLKDVSIKMLNNINYFPLQILFLLLNFKSLSIFRVMRP